MQGVRKVKTDLRWLAAAAVMAAAGSPGAFATELKLTVISVPGMHCAGCAKKITDQLLLVPGVGTAEADLAAKTVKVTPKASPTPSPRGLWEAVEKGEKKPTRLEGPNGTFTAKPFDPKPTTIAVPDMHCAGCAKKVTDQLLLVPGVDKAEADLKAKTIKVTPKADKSLSAKALWEAVEKGEQQPTMLDGPSGVFTSKAKS